MIQITKAIGSLISSVFHHHKGFGRYILIAVFLSVAILAGLTWGGWSLFEVVGEWLATLVPGNWKYESIIFKSIGFLASFLLLLMIFKYIVLILLGPVLSNISSYAEGATVSSESIGFVHSIGRAIIINVRYLISEMILTAVLLLLSFIPILSVPAVILLYLVQSYYAGRGVSDFYLEKYKSYSETLAITSTHKWACMAIGGVFMLIFIIPFLGVLLAPYVCTIAATKYFEKEI